jgi:hypothetical protein
MSKPPKQNVHKSENVGIEAVKYRRKYRDPQQYLDENGVVIDLWPIANL